MKKIIVSLIIILSLTIVISVPASAVEQENQSKDYQSIIDIISLYQGNDDYSEESLTHDVQAGDSLKEVANQYDVDIEDVVAMNALTSYVITRDQQLVIPNINMIQPASVTKEVATGKKQQQEKTQKNKVQKVKTQVTNDTPTKKLKVVATAYTAECTGCSGITATGIDLNEDRGKKVIAVDPNVIPLGTKVHVEGYGTAIAGDIGGAIKGNKIDLHVPTKEIALQWGVREVEVTILS